MKMQQAAPTYMLNPKETKTMSHKRFPLALALILSATITLVLMASLASRVEATRLSPTATTITVWHTESYTTVLDEIVTGFQTQYPTITVQLQYTDTNALYQQYLQAASAGGGPDLVRGLNDWIGSFAERGLIRSVDSDFNLSIFITRAVTGALWSGQHWAVPDTYGNHLMLYYNKDLLSSAPLSTTQMISVAKSLTTGSGQYGLVYNLNEPFWLIPWLTGYGGWVLDENANPVTPTLNTPAMADALQFVHDLRWVHDIVPSGSVDYAAADNLFRDGNAAMIINGDWTLGAYRTHFGDAHLGVARIPLVADTGQWPSPMVAGKYYMINTNSRGEALAASKLFIQYATTKPAQLLWPQYLSILPARLDALSDPLVQTDPILQASADQVSMGRLMPTSAEMRCVWDAMYVQIPLIMDDLVTPAASAAAMQADAAACATELNKRHVYLPLIMRSN